MRVILTPANGQSTATLVVNNVREDSLPIEVNVQRRLIAKDGSQSFVPEEDAFVVFPPQFSVAPGDSQAVRIQYVGVPPIDVAESYVIQFAEVPVTPPGFTGVRFAYNFGVAVYVEPAGATEKLVATGTARDGKLTLEIENVGSKYSIISRKILSIDAGSYEKTIGPDELAAKIPNTLMAPNTKRTVELEISGIPDGAVDSVIFENLNE